MWFFFVRCISRSTLSYIILKQRGKDSSRLVTAAACCDNEMDLTDLIDCDDGLHRGCICRLDAAAMLNHLVETRMSDL